MCAFCVKPMYVCVCVCVCVHVHVDVTEGEARAFTKLILACILMHHIHTFQLRMLPLKFAVITVIHNDTADIMIIITSMAVVLKTQATPTQSLSICISLLRVYDFISANPPPPRKVTIKLSLSEIPRNSQYSLDNS